MTNKYYHFFSFLLLVLILALNIKPSIAEDYEQFINKHELGNSNDWLSWDIGYYQFGSIAKFRNLISNDWYSILCEKTMTGSIDDVLKVLDELESTYPQHNKIQAQIEFQRCSIDLMIGRAKSASIHCNKAVERVNNDIIYKYYTSLCDIMLGKTDAAIATMEKIINMPNQQVFDKGYLASVIATLLGKQNRFDDAVKFYNIALSEYFTSGNTHKPTLVSLYTGLGISLDSLFNFDEGDIAFKKAMKVAKKHLNKNDEVLAYFYFTFGRHCRYIGELEIAYKYFDQSIANYILLNNGIIWKEDFLNACCEYFLISREVNKLDGANFVWRNLLPLAKQQLDENHIQAAMLYNEMAGIWLIEGKSKHALHMQNRVVKIFKENNKEIPSIYANLGSIYKKIGNHETAINYYMKSLEISKRASGEFSLNNANILSEICDSHLKLNRINDAINSCSKAVNVSEHLLGSKFPRTRYYEKQLKLVKSKS